MDRTELPAGWRWTTISDVAASMKNGVYKPPESYADDGIACLRMYNIDQGAIVWKDIKRLYLGAEEFAMYELLPGDVLINRVNSRELVGKSAVIPDGLERCVYESKNIRLRLNRQIVEPKFVGYWLQANARQYFDANAQQTVGMASINQVQLGAMPCPLPPLSEQKYIMEYIETQFTRLDAAVAALKRVQANLRRYRAAVLKAACEGRLVRTEATLAQAEGRAYEPAAALLGRILAERRARWEADHPGKKYKEPVGPDVDALPDLPEGWCWATVGQLFSVLVGSTPSRQRPEFWNGNIPWVSSGEVAFGRIKHTKEMISNEGLTNSSTKLNPPGTVLLAMIGEGKTRGQAAILDVSATNNQNSAAIRVCDTPVPPEWVFYWFMSSYEATRRSSSGGMQYALNSERVKSMVLPIAPISEMLRIIAELDERFSTINFLADKTVAASLQRIGRLRQSILQRAFSGQLTAQGVP